MLPPILPALHCTYEECFDLTQPISSLSHHLHFVRFHCFACCHPPVQEVPAVQWYVHPTLISVPFVLALVSRRFASLLFLL